MKKWRTLFKASIVTLFSALFIAIIYIVTIAPNDFGKQMPNYLANKGLNATSNVRSGVSSVALVTTTHGNAAYTNGFLSVGKLALRNNFPEFDINRNKLGDFFHNIGYQPTLGADVVTGGLEGWNVQFGSFADNACTGASGSQCATLLAANGSGGSASAPGLGFGSNALANGPGMSDAPGMNILALNLISNGNQTGNTGSSPPAGQPPQPVKLTPQLPLPTPLPAASLLFASGVLLLFLSGRTLSITKTS